LHPRKKRIALTKLRLLKRESDSNHCSGWFSPTSMDAFSFAVHLPTLVCATDAISKSISKKFFVNVCSCMGNEEQADFCTSKELG